MRILPLKMEPPVFWQRLIQTFYACAPLAYLWMAYGEWFFSAATSLVIGGGGAVIYGLARRKGYDTGWLGVAVWLATLPALLLSILGVLLYFLVYRGWYEL